MTAWRGVKAGGASETSIQIGIVKWTRLMSNKHPELKNLIHIPNQGKRSLRFGKELKDMGLSAGFPDLFLFWPKKAEDKYQGIYSAYDYLGLAIEVKTFMGKLTNEQMEWSARLTNAGYLTMLVRSVDSGIEVIKLYLGIK